MPEQRDSNSKSITVKKILYSNIFRVVAVLTILSVYYLTISPKVEMVISNGLSGMARREAKQEINTLSPIFNMHVYAGTYNLDSAERSKGITSRSKIFTMDPRVLALSKFLQDYQSPMVHEAETFISVADEYGLDWRLIVSISGVESAFGNLIPRGSYNAWGWRGINRNDRGWSMFDSWSESISHITERMALGYGTTLTPFEIQNTYCPPCGETGLDLWAKGVTRFMNELQYYVDNLDTL